MFVPLGTSLTRLYFAVGIYAHIAASSIHVLQ
jgi:hypothetical protein